MSFIADMIRRTDDRMRRQFDVDLGLASIAALAESGGAGISRRLTKRVRALQEAERHLEELAVDVEHVSAALPYLEEGWPRERDRLRRAIATDARTGTNEWLRYWFSAASQGRQAAMRRLLEDVPLPPGGLLLTRRATVATRALADSDWNLSHEILELGRRVMRGGPGKKHDARVPEDLRLLIARLALRHHLADRADEVLGTNNGETASPAVLALRSRAAGIRGDDESSRILLDQARDLDPRDLDVTIEWIRRAQTSGNPEVALDDARAAAEAFLSLGDVEGDLGRLVDVPSELYIALAERIHQKGDRDQALRLLEQAAAQPGQRTMALIEEERAALLRSRAARRKALVSAAEWRMKSGQLEVARRDLDAAIKPAPRGADDARTHAVALLRLADITVANGRQRLGRTDPTALAGTLADVVSAQERVDAGGEESWSYLTESDLRGLLARVPGDDRYAYAWGALHAAARAVALNARWPQAWLQVAETAGDLRLHALSDTAAEHGYGLAGDTADDEVTSEYVALLINGGRYEQAMAVLKGVTLDPALRDWYRCVLGCIALELGEPAEALRYFATGTIDPGWMWAWTAHVTALVTVGDLAAAREASHSYVEGATGRLTERDTWEAAAFDACVQGRPEDAMQPARSLRDSDFPGETEGLEAMGRALVLSGRPEGWDMLADAVSITCPLTVAATWEHRQRPLLVALAGERDLGPGLDRIGAMVGLRAGSADGDPLLEVRQAAESPAAPRTAQATALLVAAVVRATVEDRPEREEESDKLLAELAAAGGLDAEADALRRHRAEESAQVVNAGRDRPAPAPSPSLVLPPSWFAGIADPVRDHPLFARHLPELRRWATWPVPAVRVDTDETLEPGGYRILADGRLLAGGQVDPDLRYCPDETLAMLPDHVRADARVVRTDSGWGIPAGLAAEATGRVRLLTMSACEVVVDRYGQAVREGG